MSRSYTLLQFTGKQTQPYAATAIHRYHDLINLITQVWDRVLMMAALSSLT